MFDKKIVKRETYFEEGKITKIELIRNGNIAEGLDHRIRSCTKIVNNFFACQ